jgi:transcriptional regulator with XRE-family HTH domain
LKTLRTRGHRVLIDLLVELRTKAGLTQRDIAAHLGRDKSYIERIETRDQIPDPLECRAWSQVCGVTGWGFWWRFEQRLKVKI